MILFTLRSGIVRYLSVAQSQKRFRSGSFSYGSEHTTIQTAGFTTLCAADRTWPVATKMVQAQADRALILCHCLIWSVLSA